MCRSETLSTLPVCPWQRTLYLHRLVLQPPKGVPVDHINGDGLDNRKENLRLSSYSENSYNRRLPTHNTSGQKGVYWAKLQNKWHARIGVDGKRVHLGFFDSFEEACAVFQAAAQKYHGVFFRES